MKSNQDIGALNRRQFLLPAVASVATLLIDTSARAQTAVAKAAVAKDATPLQALISAAQKCTSTGDICLKHCIRLTKAGDKSLAGCMASVKTMLPVCNALKQLASLDSKRLKDLAKVCADVCADCETECRKHEFHHKECKNCAEACAELVKACKAVMSA